MIKPLMGIGTPDESKINDARISLRRIAAVVDKRFEGRAFVVGTSLTVADLTLASSLMYAKQCDLPLDGFVNVDGLVRAHRGVRRLDARKPVNARARGAAW